MVSKELLSEVLGYKVKDVQFDKNTINYKARNRIRWERIFRSINIHELTHKCKEWALEKDCQLVSCIKKDRSMCDIYSNTFDCKFTHYADSEPEAIFKACQWLLDNKDIK